MSTQSLSWLDKMILALVRSAARIDGMKQPDFGYQKFVVAGILSIHILGGGAVLKALGYVESELFLISPLPWWGTGLLTMGVCFALIFFLTRGASDLRKYQFSRVERWGYTAFGIFFLFSPLYIPIVLVKLTPP